jgi:mevalonate kinase
MGIAAKPSGAGGGDLGVAFAPDAAGAEALRAALFAEGLHVLPLHVVDRGVAFENEAGDTGSPSR